MNISNPSFKLRMRAVFTGFLIRHPLFGVFLRKEWTWSEWRVFTYWKFLGLFVSIFSGGMMGVAVLIHNHFIEDKSIAFLIATGVNLILWAVGCFIVGLFKTRVILEFESLSELKQMIGSVLLPEELISWQAHCPVLCYYHLAVAEYTQQTQNLLRQHQSKIEAHVKWAEQTGGLAMHEKKLLSKSLKTPTVKKKTQRL